MSKYTIPSNATSTSGRWGIFGKLSGKEQDTFEITVLKKMRYTFEIEDEVPILNPKTEKFTKGGKLNNSPMSIDIVLYSPRGEKIIHADAQSKFKQSRLLEPSSKNSEYYIMILSTNKSALVTQNGTIKEVDPRDCNMTQVYTIRIKWDYI
ncbi:hypothetical protein ACW7BJ_03375 [Azospirillum argentinense]